jgi:methylated-DNA-[protein]-cysteine S-methyltransferase
VKLTFAQLEETPLGPISFAAGDEGLRKVAYCTLRALKGVPYMESTEPSLQGMETLGTLLVEMNAYLSGLLRTFSVAIDWEGMGSFQRQVLALAAEIPYGQVLTYGEIANKLGKPGAARAVGSALGTNPMPIVIPCHRVIRADGGLSGYIGGQGVKSFLLALEGRVTSSSMRTDQSRSA